YALSVLEALRLGLGLQDLDDEIGLAIALEVGDLQLARHLLQLRQLLLVKLDDVQRRPVTLCDVSLPLAVAITLAVAEAALLLRTRLFDGRARAVGQRFRA